MSSRGAITAPAPTERHKKFAHRNGSTHRSCAWFAAIWVVTDGFSAGEDSAEEDAIADAPAIMLEHGRDLTAEELSELLTHGSQAVAVAIRLIAL